MQEAVLVVLRRPDLHHDPAKLQTRIWGDLKDRYRREWEAYFATRRAGSQGLDDAMIPDDQLDDAAIDVRDAIGRLPEPMRSVARAILVEGRTQTEVAAARGVSQPSVWKTLQKAKAALRELLSEYAGGHES